MKSIKRNFLYNILLNVSRVIFPLITAPYISRILEPEGIGLFNFSTTYASYFALVALLGIPTYGVREVSKIRDDKVALQNLISQIMTLAFMATLIVSVVYFLSMAFISKISENSIIFLLTGFYVYLAPFQINWYYQGIEEFGYITFRTLAIRVLSLIILFLFVHQKEDLIVYVIITVMSTVLADVWNFAKMWKSGIHPSLTCKGIHPHTKPLFTLFASSVAISIYTVLDTLMLGFISDYEQVGYYSNAIHMSKVFLSIVTSLSVVTIPRFAYYIKQHQYADANELVNKSFSFVGLASFPLSIGIACIAPVFVPWFFGEQFYGSIIPLMILGFLNIAIGFSNIAGIQILVGIGKDKLFLNSLLLGTISNFLLNCLLIPFLGAKGASIASVIAEFSVTLSMLYYIYKKTPMRVTVGRDLLCSFVGALLFIPLYLFFPKVEREEVYLFTFILSATVVYIISQLLLKNSSMQVIVSIIRSRFHYPHNTNQ